MHGGELFFLQLADMAAGEHLVLTLAAGLSAALVLGYVTHRLGLSPIVGYLLAGVLVGPNTPGFVADRALASQLSEIGVILLMFGVGLHFHPSDLWAVRRVAVPGAIAQSVVATGLGAAIGLLFGWSLSASLVLGAAISVASTVVLTRVLLDNDALDTGAGRISIGWLIVEDILTIVILILLPIAAKTTGGGVADAARGLGLAFLKLGLLLGLILGVGARVVPWLLDRVARSRSRELFTLAVLSVALAIAVGSSKLFGASMALGAFLAGTVVGRSELSHQAAAEALPMRDAFAVVFFLSVGMLLDPKLILEQPLFVAALVLVVLVAKPAVALFIVLGLGRSVRSALTAAVGLAQIGEFSFILSQAATKEGLAPPETTNVLVAVAIISITTNPIAFRTIGPIEGWLRGRPRLWALLTRRATAAGKAATQTSVVRLADLDDRVRAIVVGYGPVGATACDLLRDFEVEPVVIELNVDTVTRLVSEGRSAIYGDASRREILEAAGIARARYLITTQPDLASRTPVIAAARALNPRLRILSRARYLAEKPALETLGVAGATYEEAESAVGLATLLLEEVGAPPERIEKEVEELRGRFALRPSPLMALRPRPDSTRAAALEEPDEPAPAGPPPTG